MIINFMKGEPLDHAPGTVYAYSNFGYCLLGRIIEAITGMPYYQYIETNVLHPAGIWDMVLGKPLLTDANPAEVDYDDQLRRVVPTVMGATSPPYVPIQYGGWNISSMDSHGGWLATAADLVRFSSSFDVPTNSPLLSYGMYNLMASRPPYPNQDQNAATYYGAGWSVRPEGNGTYNLWHDGSLDGTFTYTVRLANGICWATVFNRRDVIGDVPNYENIDPEMNTAVASVASWPSYNLFDSNGDGLLDAWQIYYFGSINSPNAAPTADPNGIGYDNLSAYINGTDPTNPGSVERLYAVSGAPNSESVALNWMASRGRLYTIVTTTNLALGNWQALPAAVSVVGDNTTHSITNAASGTSFYRLQVQAQRP
jgi:CubicO group peptidase (beta-lactamase class C family)